MIGNVRVLAGQKDVIDSIIDLNTGDRAIHYAVLNRKYKLIEFLLENGVNINLKTKTLEQAAL